MDDIPNDLDAQKATDYLDLLRAYWDRQPCNSNHSGSEFASRAYFDEVEARRYFVHPHIAPFAEFANWQGRKVLEIGCGIGTDAIRFARHGSHYTGVELSPNTLAMAQKRMEIYGLGGEFHLHNAERLDEILPESSYDLVYSIGVIHHTVRPKAIIHAARRLIKADGELRIMVYSKNSWKSAMIEAGLDQPESQDDCPIALTFDEDGVRDLLSGHFDIVDMHQDHIFPYQIEPYKEFRYEKEPWFEAMPSEMFRALEARFGWHWMIRAKPV